MKYKVEKDISGAYWTLPRRKKIKNFLAEEIFNKMFSFYNFFFKHLNLILIKSGERQGSGRREALCAFDDVIQQITYLVA